MKLGTLLFAGKSVANGSAAVSYRENKRVALPKFVSPKNPFAPKKSGGDAHVAPSGGGGAAATPPVLSPVSGASKSLTTWTAKLNPVALWSQPASAGQKSLPAVQSELSLDTVKVVHNDLSDADVEVVPIKSRPAAPDLSPMKKSWELLGERLLKATAL